MRARLAREEKSLDPALLGSENGVQAGEDGLPMPAARPVGDAADSAAALELTGGAHDRTGETDVGLDHGGDLEGPGAARYLLEPLVVSLEQCALVPVGVAGADDDVAGLGMPYPSAAGRRLFSSSS